MVAAASIALTSHSVLFWTLLAHSSRDELRSLLAMQPPAASSAAVLRALQCLSPRLLSETDLASCAPKKVRTTSQVNAETTTPAQVSRSTEVANTAGA